MRPPGLTAALGAALFFLPALTLGAECDLTGRTARVVDGDTLHLAVSAQKKVKIRLADIDTPERDQPYGREATQALSDLAYQGEICADVITTDRYGREVAHLYQGDAWINQALVKQGAAWVYRKYAKAPYRRPLLEAEANAKKADRGLWASDGAVPPWEWRRR